MPVLVAGAEREPFAGYPLIGRPPILVAGAGRAPTAGRVRVGAPDLATSDITAELLDPTDPTLTTVLEQLDPGAFDRSWLEQLNDAGSAAINFDLDDPLVELIGDGALIRMSLRGARAVVMLVEPVDETLLAPGEEDDQVAVFSGRLHVALMEWALVEGSRGILQKPVQENRNFDYTEEQYDDSWWSSPAVLGTVAFMRFAYFYIPGDIGTFTRFLNETPEDIASEFPDPFAWVLGPPGATILRGRPLPLDSGGDHYGRQWITVPTACTVRVAPLGDDEIEINIDGVQAAQAGTGSMATSSGSDIDLSAGRHLVSWHVNSKTDAQVAWTKNPGGKFNAAYGAWTISRSDAATAVEGFIAHSDHTAKVTPYLDKKPGMSPGRAVRLVREENLVRGVRMPTLGCTDTDDRDGNPWATDATPTRVGNDAFSWLQEMGVTAVDFAMAVDEFRLDLWNSGGRGVVRGAFSFHGPTDPDDPDSTNIARLHRKKGTITNSFLVRAAYGWDIVERASSIAEHGRRRAMLSLGSYDNPAAVFAATNKQLDIVAVERVQYDLEHDPATDAEFAYIGFEVGDWILLEAGDESAYRRVVSIAPAEQTASDDNNVGEASVIVTLGDVVMYASPLEFHVAKLSQAVKKLANGSGLGDFVIAQPVTPPAVATPISAWSPPVGGLGLAGAHAEGITGAGTVSTDFTFDDSTEFVWLLSVVGGTSVNLLDSGRAAVDPDHSGSFTAGFRTVAAVATNPITVANGDTILMALARYGTSSTVNVPKITHPDVSLGLNLDEELDSRLGTYTNLADGDGAGAFTIELRDRLIGMTEFLEETTEIAWIIYSIPGGNPNTNFSSGSGTSGTAINSLTGTSNVIVFVADTPGIVPAFPYPWNLHRVVA